LSYFFSSVNIYLFFILLVLYLTQSIVNLFRVLFLFNKIGGSLFTTTTNSILLYLLIFANSRWHLELQLAAYLVAFQEGEGGELPEADPESFLRGCSTARNFFRAGAECENSHL